MFVTDTNNSFTTDSELLQDVSQLQLQSRNLLLSANDKYNSEHSYSLYSQLLVEINWYKAYDV